MRLLLTRAAAIFAGVIASTTLCAQDIHFSQFYETTILRNPAMVGVFAGDYKLGATYRSQWNSISQPFQTGMISAETRFAVSNEVNDFVSFGLLGYYDKAGSISMQTIGVYPSITYNKSLEDNYNSFLSVGFTGGYIQRSFDPTKITVDNQYLGNRFDPANPTGENFNNPQVANWDLGAGVSFSSTSGSDTRHKTSYYVGFSGYHFTQPNNSFLNDKTINLEMKLNATAGMSMALNETYNAQFHANYMIQGKYNELIFGGLLGWGKAGIDDDMAFGIFAGLFYRLNDAVIPTAKIKYKDYTFGISYDVNASTLSNYSNLRGGYEITAFKTGLFKSTKFQKAKTICPHSFW